MWCQPWSIQIFWRLQHGALPSVKSYHKFGLLDLNQMDNSDIFMQDSCQYSKQEITPHKEPSIHTHKYVQGFTHIQLYGHAFNYEALECIMSTNMLVMCNNIYIIIKQTERIYFCKTSRPFTLDINIEGSMSLVQHGIFFSIHVSFVQYLRHAWWNIAWELHSSLCNKDEK